MCLIFEFFQGQNAVSKKTKALVNYERIYIGERHAHEQKKTNWGTNPCFKNKNSGEKQTRFVGTKFWFEFFFFLTNLLGFEKFWF